MDWQIATPVIVAAVGFITWLLQTRLEAIRRENDRLHDTRRGIYVQILKPFILTLAGAKDEKVMRQAIKQIQSVDHRYALFELNLIGSDDVVRAMNAFMQHIYNYTDAYAIITKLGELLLAIRKDLGNKKTKLEPIDMFRTQITDIEKLVDRESSGA